MSSNKRSLLSATTITALAAAPALVSTACHCRQRALTGTGIEMQNMDRTRAHYGSHLRDMADNAILYDMSVADIHFVAHTSELSGTGVDRLERMAALLNTYGGTVRYETDLRDQALLKQRLEHVREYLTVAGCNMDRVEVKAMISGGRGMAADKAIIVDLKGTAKPESTRGSQTAVPRASGGSQN